MHARGFFLVAGQGRAGGVIPSYALLRSCTLGASNGEGIMPNIIIPDEALNNWLEAQLENYLTLNDCVLRLFKSPLAIDANTTLAELNAAQSNFPGYGAKVLEEWSPSVIIAGVATTIPDDVKWEATAADTQLVHGCYATNSASSKLWFAVDFNGAVNTPFGFELVISTTFEVDSLYST